MALLGQPHHQLRQAERRHALVRRRGEAGEPDGGGLRRTKHEGAPEGREVQGQLYRGPMDHEADILPSGQERQEGEEGHRSLLSALCGWRRA